MKFKKLSLLISSALVAVPCLFAITGCENKVTISPNTLCLNFNDYLEKATEDGSHQHMIDEWFSLDSVNKSVDYSSLRDVNGKVVIGILDGIQPFTYVGQGGYTGLVIDMMTRFCKEYEYGVKFEAYNSVGALISAVNAGTIDIGATSTTITDERSQAVLFSKPYMNDEPAFLIRKEDSTIYKSASDFDGKTVGIIAGGLYGEMLHEFAPNATIKEYYSVSDLCLALEEKNVDGGLSDGSSFRFASLSHPTLGYFSQHLLDNFLGVFFRKTTYTLMEELNGKTIGVFDEPGVQEYIRTKVENPNFKVYQYEEENQIRKDLDEGKIEAACVYTDVARYNNKSKTTGFALINEPLYQLNASLAFPVGTEGKQHLVQINSFIEENKETYLLNNLRRDWLSNTSKRSVEVPNYLDLPAINGKLIVGLDASEQPYSSVQNGIYSGIFIDYLSIFAEKYGYGLEFHNCLHDDLTSFFEEGTINAYIDVYYLESTTDEYYRSQSIGTSDINFMVRDSYSTKENIFQQIGTNFKKTFIVEDRYLTFLNGIGTTLLITVCSIFLGLLLGFLVFILLRTNNKISNIIYRIIEFIISGTPAVVFLMICFYIFFAGSNLSGTFVSIIAFGFIFMCSTVSMLKTSFNAIDKGQAEAAFALGYSKPRTFFKILLPQASKTFMPILKGNIVEHIKATAIVGYIAIVDLTKAGEIVRSRTFDAIFSLIVVTILYFLIEYLFVLLLKLIPVDPKKRKNIGTLKGVENHD